MSEIVKKEEIPGIGMSGLVMCPLMRGACLKNGCEWWVSLNCAGSQVGRCAMSWMPILNIEVRGSLDKLSELQKSQEEIK